MTTHDHDQDTDAAPRLQCESCGDMVPETDLELHAVPGATLAFCHACTRPPRHVQYGVRP